MIHRTGAATVIAMQLAACGITEPPDTPPAPAPTASRDAVRPPLPASVQVRPEAPDEGVTGEVPAELLAQVVGHAAELTGVAAPDMTVIRGESVTWNDGSLGCARPGEMYTQALVPGYWIVLQAGERRLDYRADARGSFRLCELS